MGRKATIFAQDAAGNMVGGSYEWTRGETRRDFKNLVVSQGVAGFPLGGGSVGEGRHRPATSILYPNIVRELEGIQIPQSAIRNPNSGKGVVK